MIPRATYRLQLHAGFTFADAKAIVPYLNDLGISHVYASPITVARAGSTHGYDAIDPTRVDPALDGEAGLRELVGELRARNMGVILDIVPNHMGVGPENPWWTDVLANGRESIFADYFDIDWSRHNGRMLLPFLREPLPRALDAGDIRLAPDGGRLAVAYHESRFPLRPGSAPPPGGAALYDPATPEGRKRLADLLDRQHYLLAWHRVANDELNWRRFFSINDLAGLRIEADEVFEAVHALPLRLYAEGLIDGLRIDHVDGLTDPASYCRKLRARLDALDAERPAGLGGSAWLIVEKILGSGEALPGDWDVDGTTGYEFMDEVSMLLHAPEGEAPLDERWERLTGGPAGFETQERQARTEIVAREFGAQTEACVDAFHELAQAEPETAAFTRGMIHRAVTALLGAFPVYRTYGTGEDAPATDAPIHEAARAEAMKTAAPEEMVVIDFVLGRLAGEGDAEAAEAVRRFQQLSAPVAAKAVEDTAFYRYGRLLSRNDVGFDPARFAMPVEEFQSRMAQRARDWPRSMLTTATHDHKRGEDTRARLAVLSAVPELWAEHANRWCDRAADRCGEIEPGDLEMLFQTVVGAWPDGLSPGDRKGLADYAERLRAWQEKALREAKTRSSWAAPQADYEGRLYGVIAWLLDGAGAATLAEIAAFVAKIEPAARANMMAQTALRCLAPGVPDLYQGAEFRDLSLVDPDNRRPVDFTRRAVALSAAAPVSTPSNDKQALIARLLEMRRAAPDLFESGTYEQASTSPAAHGLIQFARRRGDALLLAAVEVRRNRERIDAMADTMDAFWGDAVIDLSPEQARIAGVPRLALRDMRDAPWPAHGAPSVFVRFLKERRMSKARHQNSQEGRT